MIAESGTRVTPDEIDGLELAHLILDAHLWAEHAGVLQDDCPDCARYAANEEHAAREFAVAYEGAA